MKNLLFALFFLFLINCSKPKTVFICGDHVCVNNAEAEQYFKDNLSIEVKILDNKIKDEINLVELNLKENKEGRKKINISSKNKINKDLKTLSDKEIKKIKDNLKKKQKDIALINKNSKKANVRKKNENLNKEKNIKKMRSNSNKEVSSKIVYKNKNDVFDVCTILEKCSIDEISKYLLNQGSKKKFPDITRRQLK